MDAPTTTADSPALTDGLHHVGYVVSDAEATSAFFLALGAEIVGDTRFSGAEFDEALGLEGVDLRAIMIKIGPSLIELLQYDSPASTAPRPRNCDLGAPHVAVHVTDIFETQRRLEGNGVRFYSSPNPIVSGPMTGGYFCYCQDPDGLSVELLQPSPLDPDQE